LPLKQPFCLLKIAVPHVLLAALQEIRVFGSQQMHDSHVGKPANDALCKIGHIDIVRIGVAHFSYLSFCVIGTK